MPDYRVKSATTDDITVSGEQTVSGFPLVDGDRVLKAIPEGSVDSGPWIVRVGTWDRPADVLEPGTDYYVTHGPEGSEWRLRAQSAPTVGSDVLYFEQRVSPDDIPLPGIGIDVDTGIWNFKEVLGTPGIFNAPTILVDEYGRIIGLESTDIGVAHMEGLGVERDSSNSLTVKAGSAFIPGLSKPVTLVEDLPLTGLSLAASTRHNLYLYEGADVTEVEVSSEPPDEPYFGHARTKGGTTPDDTRRYIGYLVTDAAGDILYVHGESNPKARVFLGSVSADAALTGSANSTYVKVPFSTALKNNTGTFDAANRRFTPDEAGEYRIGGHLGFVPASLGAGHTYRLALYKNGVFHRMLDQVHVSQTRDLSAIGGVPVRMNGTTDYVELFSNTSNNSAASVNTTSYFSVEYLGG